MGFFSFLFGASPTTHTGRGHIQNVPNNRNHLARMSDPRNAFGWRNPASPNNPNGWTNMNSFNNPFGWRNPASPNNPNNHHMHRPMHAPMHRPMHKR